MKQLPSTITLPTNDGGLIATIISELLSRGVIFEAHIEGDAFIIKFD
tara:strand:+ start:2549 stop:2689 length:141 start_codon:yes stop_codon:yes gene_type:complete